MACMAARLSTVHRGVAFEQRSLNTLQSHLSMSLHKVGGKSDGGIDLQGWWWLPPMSRRPPTLNGSTAVFTGQDGGARRRLRVLGQCKAEKKKMGPNYVREMEGVLHRHYSVAANQPVVALLVSESAFTRSTLLRAFSSPIPFFLLHLPPLREKTGNETEGENEADLKDGLGSAIWNPALGGEEGLLGGEIEARWERSLTLEGGRPSLWWKGKRLKGWTPPDMSLDDDTSMKDVQ